MSLFDVLPLGSLPRTRHPQAFRRMRWDCSQGGDLRDWNQGQGSLAKTEASAGDSVFMNMNMKLVFLNMWWQVWQ